jgi:hypothetical protein
VTELSAKGTSLVYSRYLGGSGNDLGYGIALWDNMAYVTGQTSSTDFPLQRPVQAALGGPEDAFVTRLGASGATLLFSTYLGGTGLGRGARHRGHAGGAGPPYVDRDSRLHRLSPVHPACRSRPASVVASGTRSSPRSFRRPPTCPWSRWAVIRLRLHADELLDRGHQQRTGRRDECHPRRHTSSGPDPVGVSTSVGFCTAGPGERDVRPQSSAEWSLGDRRTDRRPAERRALQHRDGDGREPDLDPGNNTGATFTFVWPPPWCWPFGCPPC